MLTAAFGMIIGVLVASLKPWAATAVGVLAAVFIFGCACYLMFGRHVWFPWLIVAGAQVPSRCVGQSSLIGSG